jgi:hypothetical protein
VLKFNNQFIVFIVLFPGILCNILIVILLQCTGFSIANYLDSEVLILGFGSVFSLLMGAFILALSQENFILINLLVKKYRLRFFKTQYLTKEIDKLTMELPDIETKIKEDFGKEVSLENATNGSYIKEIFDDIYYGLNRAISIPKIVSIRLLRDFLPPCIIAIGLVGMFTLLTGVFLVFKSTLPLELVLFFLFQIIIFGISKISLLDLDAKYYSACLNVYTAKQYRDLNFKIN